MKNQTEETVVSAVPKTPKKPYCKPTLRRLGELKAVAATSGRAWRRVN